jgi:Rrf2 family nitric oxide-sensitive transcriptional repressor
MRLTQFSDYSLRALMFISLRDGENSSIAEIARAYAISEHHLTKVIHRLGQLGLVKTTRGRNGGLRLGRRPEEISLGQVVRQTEEDLAIAECFGRGCCAIAGVCELQRVLNEALQAFLFVLDRHTLADLIRPQGAALAYRLGFASPGEAAAL